MALNRKKRDRKKSESFDDFEYYEDTHNARGDYIGNRTQGFNSQVDINVPTPQYDNMKTSDNVAMPMGNGQRIIVYFPKTPEDVQVLINHLRMNNPAVVNLDEGLDDYTAQRILDMLSGAACALEGTVHRISNNLFLLSPHGVETSIPYEQK